MSRDRIGIEVDVKFPTVKELQAEMARKWQSVKNGFEAKINVGIDGNSLRSLRSKINNSLKQNVFDIKLNTDITHALKNIQKVRKEIKNLDEQLKKSRNLKIDVKTLDFDRTFREIIQDSKRVEQELNKQKSAYQGINAELDKQQGKMAKIQKVQKTLADGTKLVTDKFGYTGKLGYGKTISHNPDGSVEEAVTHNRKQALKEIETILARIYKLTNDQVGADKKVYEVLEREKRAQKEQLSLLQSQYKERYKISAFKDDSVKDLIHQQRLNLELKNRREATKKVKEEEKRIADAISKAVQLEKEKQRLAKAMVNAQGEELASLSQQFSHHQKIQKALISKSNLMNRMTSEQKKEFENVKKVGSLEIQKLNQKKKQLDAEQKLSKEKKRQADLEKQALSDMKKDLLTVHKLELKIREIKKKQETAGRDLTREEKNRLQILEKELDIARRHQSETERFYRDQKAITEETRKQLKAEGEILNREKERVSAISRIQGTQEKVTRSLQEWKELGNEINRLQRDLIFSGTREQKVIEEQISALSKKQEVIVNNLQKEKLMTNEMKEELALTKKIQQEQRELNRARQDARERDRSLSDAHGVIDPYSFYHHVERGATSVLEPVARLDEAFTGVAKVADASEKQMREFAEGAFEAGNALGVTADEYMLAVEKWVTAGKGFQESQELAKISLTGAFVGNIEPDLMVKYMSVPFEAYRKQGIEANDIINVMNETANNHAIEMDELGKAYMRSAMSARDAGVSYEELTGFITGAQEATRRGGERIGTGIKTMAINVANIFSRLTAGNDTKFEWFKNIGVNFEDESGKMRTMTEIYRDLAEVWDDLSDGDKGVAKFYLAGKEHAETLGAIMDQWDTSVKSTIEDAGGELGNGEMGSAYIEHAKQADSVRFKLAELKNAWDELMTTVGGGKDGVGSVLGALTKGLQKLNDLATNESFLESLKYIFIGLGMHAGTNAIKRFLDAANTGLGGMINNAREAKTLMKSLRSDTGKKGRQKQAGSVDYGEGSNTAALYGVGRPPARMNKRQRKKWEAQQRRMYEDQQKQMQNTTVVPKVDGKEVGKVEGKMKNTLKLGGKLLSLIPLLGDALLILDIAGVPVFETVEKGFKKIFTSAKDTRKEIEEFTKKTLATNEILNGSTAQKYETAQNLRDQFDKANLSKGYMNEKEFIEFRDQFNSFAKEVGLKDKYGIQIEVSMNDTAEIEEKLRLLKEHLQVMEYTELKGVDKAIKKAVNDSSTAQSDLKKANDELDSLNERLERAQSKKAELLNKQSEGPLNMFEKMDLDEAIRDVERLGGEIDKKKESISDLNGIVEHSSNSIQEYTKSLVDHVKSGGNLNGIGFDQLRATGEVAMNTWKDLTGQIEVAGKASKEIKKTNELTKTTYEELARAYPSEIGTIAWEEVEAGKVSLDTIMKRIEKAKEKKQVEADANRELLASIGEQIGAFEVVRNKAGEITGVIVKNKDKYEEFKKAFQQPISANPMINFGIGRGSDIWNWISKKLGMSNEFSINVKLGTTVANTASNAVLRRLGMPGVPSFFSVSSAQPEGVASTSGGVSSASVSSVGSGILSSPTSVASVDQARSTKSSKRPKKKSKKPVNNSRVNSDVWRYWGIESYGIDRLENSMANLTRAISDNADNEKKLISLYRQQQALLRQQISQETRLKSAKDSEINSVLRSLKKYGFRVDTKSNKVLNLGHAKKLKGSKAEKADDLLNRWRSLYSEINNINVKIGDMRSNISNLGKDIKQARIDDEAKKIESSLKKIDAVLKKIQNSTALSDKRLSLVSGADKELNLQENAKAMNVAKSNMSELIKEFNKLSKKTSTYKENGEQLVTALESIGSEILSQADAIIQYQQAINDLEFDRVVDDMNKFNDAIDSNVNKLNDNLENMKEGLLSGTKLSDLQSSKASGFDVGRKNAYETLAKQRIDLEKKVQDALTAFAKKNIDRSKKVANATLQITAKKYNQMLKMEANYSKGNKATYKKIQSQFGDLIDIGVKDGSYTFIKKIDKAFDTVLDAQNALTKKFNADLAKALTEEQKQNVTNKYIVENLKLQERYFKASIDASKKAIEELKKQLKDSTLTSDQKENIKDAIKDYENDITSAQNSIKDTIRERFEFEFSLIKEAIDKYDKYAKELDYRMSILDTVGGDNFKARGNLLEEMLNHEKKRNLEIEKSIATLQKQLSMYEEGSFEWKLINEQVEDYRDLLKDSNKELLDMHHNIMSNSFESTIREIERKIFDGKTLDQFKDYQDLWMDGLEREIALEEMYQRIADLGTSIYEEKMALLDKQEKLSRSEMDYLNKQLDILELEQKLENLNREKTVQVLRQQADGTWDWVYEADQTQISDTEKELNDARKELQDMENDARENYLNKLKKILDDAESGVYDNVSELEEAIKDLGKSFETIIGEIPEIQNGYIKDLMNAYRKYLKDSKPIVDGAGVGGLRSESSYSVSSMKAVNNRAFLADMISDAVDMIEDSISSSFVNVDHRISKPPESTKDTSESIDINIDRIEFPNIKSPDGIQEAIMDLPRIAIQKAKSK